MKAKHLLDGDAVTRMPGGSVEYDQMIFDRHEIGYDEGIASEILFVDSTTRRALPLDAPAQVNKNGRHRAIELYDRHLRAEHPADLLRRASIG